MVMDKTDQEVRMRKARMWVEMFNQSTDKHFIDRSIADYSRLTEQEKVEIYIQCQNVADHYLANNQKVPDGLKEGIKKIAQVETDTPNITVHEAYVLRYISSKERSS